MILVDTCVWIDHLHHGEERLAAWLRADLVGCHPAVIEELALGSLTQREEVLARLADLRSFPLLSHAECLALIEAHRLWSRGLSATDVHVLGAALLQPGARLWTRDKRLRRAATDVGASLVAD